MPQQINLMLRHDLSCLEIKQLEQLYLKQTDRLKHKLRKGSSWKNVEKERNAMTILAIAIHENHHKSYTDEKPVFGEYNV
jgi:hypothetical protein